MRSSVQQYVILSKPARDASGRTRPAGSVLRMHDEAARAYAHRGEVERSFPVADDYAVTTSKGVTIVSAEEALVMARDRRTGSIVPFDGSFEIGAEPDSPKTSRRGTRRAKAKSETEAPLIGDE